MELFTLDRSRGDCVGAVYRTRRVVLTEPAATLGICYEQYYLRVDRGATGTKRPGYSILLQGGHYDGFAPEEMAVLQHVGHSPVLESYEFQNVIKLIDDYRAGLFGPMFTAAEHALVSAGLEEFVRRGQQAQAAVDQILDHPDQTL